MRPQQLEGFDNHREVVLSKMDIWSSKKAFKRLASCHLKQKGGCRYRDDECKKHHALLVVGFWAL